MVGKTDHSSKPGGQLEARRLMVQADMEASGPGTVNLRHSRRYVSGKDTPKGLYTGPYFSPGLVSNYTASVGETIRLNCKVYQVHISLHKYSVPVHDVIVFLSHHNISRNDILDEFTNAFFPFLWAH